MSNESSLPTIDFMTLVVSLSQTALVHLGEVVDLEGPPGSGEAGGRQLDLPMARQTIDLLGVLQEKTKGNLTGEEERLLDQVLYDLRLRFVEVARESAKTESKEAKA